MQSMGAHFRIELILRCWNPEFIVPMTKSMQRFFMVAVRLKIPSIDTCLASMTIMSQRRETYSFKHRDSSVSLSVISWTMRPIVSDSSPWELVAVVLMM